jgi:hypothetical protein
MTCSRGPWCFSYFLLREVCRALNLSHTANGVREGIATRIIELARHGERDPDRLRDRVIAEAVAANGNGSGSLGSVIV